MPGVRRWITSILVAASLWGGGLLYRANHGDSRPEWDARDQFDVPPAEAMRAFEALRYAPSTLAGLGVTVARPRFEPLGDKAVAIVVPAAQRDDEVRFTFEFEPHESGKKTIVGLTVSTGDLPELDLGSDRLINRTALAERAADALGAFANGMAGRTPAEVARERFGRVFDQAGLLGDPLARTQVARLNREEGRLDPLFRVMPRPSDEPEFDESANYPTEPSPNDW